MYNIGNSLAGPIDLEFLSVKYNFLLYIKIGVKNIVNAKYIDTNNFYICCSISREIFCNAKRPSYVSCLSLMQKAHDRLSLLISFIILSLNLLSVILHLSYRRTQKNKIKAFHLIVTSLSTVDLTLGLYLLIIWFADSFHKEHFIMKAFLWKSDRVCFLSYALLLNFNILSPVLLLFMAFSRLFVVIYPLKSTFIRSSTVFLCVLMKYLMVGMITVSFTIFKRVQRPVVLNTLCSPFVDPTKNNLSTKILICIIAVLQLSCAVLIFIIYMYIEISVQNSVFTFKTSFGKEQGNIAFTTQIVILNVSIVLCWLPVNITNFLMLVMDRFSMQAVAWVTIAIMPINSVIYPLVFIITTFRKKN